MLVPLSMAEEYVDIPWDAHELAAGSSTPGPRWRRCTPSSTTTRASSSAGSRRRTAPGRRRPHGLPGRCRRSHRPVGDGRAQRPRRDAGARGAGRARRCPAWAARSRRPPCGACCPRPSCAPSGSSGISDDHSGLMELPRRPLAGRRAIAAALGLDEPTLEIEVYAQPARPPFRLRHRPGSGRPHRRPSCRPPRRRSPRRRSRSTRRPQRGGARPGPLPPLHRPGDPGREDRPVARLDAPAAAGGGHAAHQQRGRHDQLRHAGTGPAPPRLRLRPARRAADRRPPGEGRGDAPDPRRRDAASSTRTCCSSATRSARWPSPASWAAKTRR